MADPRRPNKVLRYKPRRASITQGWMVRHQTTWTCWARSSACAASCLSWSGAPGSLSTAPSSASPPPRALRTRSRWWGASCCPSLLWWRRICRTPSPWRPPGDISLEGTHPGPLYLPCPRPHPWLFSLLPSAAVQGFPGWCWACSWREGTWPWPWDPTAAGAERGIPWAYPPPSPPSFPTLPAPRGDTVCVSRCTHSFSCWNPLIKFCIRAVLCDPSLLCMVAVCPNRGKGSTFPLSQAWAPSLEPFGWFICLFRKTQALSQLPETKPWSLPSDNSADSSADLRNLGFGFLR